MHLNIIQDTREKVPWNFAFYQDVGSVERKAMKTGDYTLKEIMNLEKELDKKIFCVERKRSTGEISLNLGRGKKRFFEEMDRMQHYEFKALVLEFSVDDVYNFPENSMIPKKKWKYIRIGGNYLKKMLDHVEGEYGIEVIYAGTTERAQDIFIERAQEVYDVYKSRICN